MGGGGGGGEAGGKGEIEVKHQLASRIPGIRRSTLMVFFTDLKYKTERRSNNRLTAGTRNR